MALTIKNLSAGYLATSTGEILGGDTAKSKLVKNIIITNNDTSQRTITLYIKLLTAASPETYTEYPITPIDLAIPAKGQVVIESELTLQAKTLGSSPAITRADTLTGKASVASQLTYVINGMERDL